MRSSGRRLGSVHGAKSCFEPVICPHSDARSGFSPDYLTQIEPAANAGVRLCAICCLKAKPQAADRPAKSAQCVRHERRTLIDSLDRIGCELARLGAVVVAEPDGRSRL